MHQEGILLLKLIQQNVGSKSKKLSENRYLGKVQIPDLILVKKIIHIVTTATKPLNPDAKTTHWKH